MKQKVNYNIINQWNNENIIEEERKKRFNDKLLKTILRTEENKKEQ